MIALQENSRQALAAIKNLYVCASQVISTAQAWNVKRAPQVHMFQDGQNISAHCANMENIEHKKVVQLV